MPAIVSFHPTYAFFHNPYEAGTFVVDLGRFKRLMDGTLAAKPIIYNQPTLDDLKRLVKRGAPIAVDIETGPTGDKDAEGNYLQPWTGKSPLLCRLRTIGLGNRYMGMSWTWDELKRHPKVLRFIRKLLASRGQVKLFHNGHWFDVPVLRRYGFKVRNWRDTRDFRRALCNYSPLSLRYLTSIATDTHNWKDEEKKQAKDGKGVIFTRDLNKLKIYNAQDTVFTARVDDMCLEDYRTTPPDYQPIVNTLYNYHRDLSSLCANDMYRTGLRVNQDWRGFLRTCCEQAIAEKEATFLSLVNIDGMRCTHDDMRALLYRMHENERVKRFSLPDPLDKNMYTDDAMLKVSVDVESLILLIVSGEAPPEAVAIIEAFWDVETEKKRLGYLKSHLVDEAIGPDGRLRPGWNSCGTDTMRFSCSEPNVMNIEQDLRCIFGPAPGYTWSHADKSQLELRMMEAVSGDEFLYKLIKSGDVYSTLACEWFQLDPAKFNKDENKADKEARKSSKIIFLARQYRAGLKRVFAQALKEDRKFTFQRVRLLVSTFDKTFTGIVKYWDDELEKVGRVGYSEGYILGGRHYYPALPEAQEVANKPIQRSASEMMNVETLKLRAKLKKHVPSARIIGQLHDAVDVEHEDRHTKIVGEIMEECLGTTWTIRGRTREFPIELKTAVGELGQTWADV